jgi:hypothetical protein
VKLYGIVGRVGGGVSIRSKQLYGSPEEAKAAAPAWKKAAYEAGVTDGFLGTSVAEYEVDDAVVRALLGGSDAR